LLFAHSNILFAGTTGKISGTVTNAETGESLPGANVMIEGTTMGAATDANGFYFIINIPPGYYSVNATMIGYTPISKALVQVVTDMTSKVEFGLSPTILEGEVVRVIAERPAIQKDLTSSLQAYSSGEINDAPMDNLAQLMEIQAGITPTELTEVANILRGAPSDGLHIRGGRVNETAFLVDGVRVDNPIWGGAGYSQNSSGSTVTEMMTILGTFNAEYGGKMSGVINLVTKEGENHFGARFSGYTDNFGIPRYDRNTWQGDLTLSGPVPLTKDLFFLVNAQSRTTDGRFKAYLIPKWTDSKGQVSIKDDEGNPLGKEVSGDWTDEYNYLTKLIWKPGRKIKLMGSYVKSRVMQLRYYHDYKYFPYGMPWRDTESDGLTGKLTYQFNPRTFSEMAVTSQRINYWYGVHKIREQRLLLEGREEESEYGFYYTGGRNNYWIDSSRTVQLVTSITSQIGTGHLIKAGLDVRRFDLFHQLSNAWAAPVDSLYVEQDDGSMTLEGFESHGAFAHADPIEAAVYLQDKMEFEEIGMILNVGIRWESWDLGKKHMEDPNLPMATDLIPTKAKTRISPRLGVSYPISDKAAFHFAYGHFYQMPSYVDLLSAINEKGPYSERPNLSSIGFAIFNPDCKPEKSVTFEGGVQTYLAPSVSLNVTVFYREMADLIGVDYILTQEGGYGYFDNMDFGNSKGLEFILNKKYSNHYSARINYTISQTMISTSSPMSALQEISEESIAYKTYPADWDRTHNFSGLARYSKSKWGVNLSCRARSGRPYSVLAETLNTERLPWNISVNLRIDRYVQLLGRRQRLFLQVFNLFDRRNIYSVYSETGKWNDDGNSTTAPEQDANPRRRSDGRSARIGINIEF
jgi:outer membrane receptor protein involved in Fe transport